MPRALSVLAAGRRLTTRRRLTPRRWRGLVALALIAPTGLAACAGPIDAYEGAPLSDGAVATILGGGLPHLRSVDDRPIAPEPIVGPPDARVPAGARTLVVDYQPCFTATLCGLAAVSAEVVLRPQGVYVIRHETRGCTPWDALASVARRQSKPCRNYLWIAERASGETVWGEAPAAGND